MKEFDCEIIVYSRDEGKQALYFGDDSTIKRVIGDVRDLHKLELTMKRHKPNYVIHTAALKRIDDLEFYPDECVETNIEGSKNVAYACHEHNIEKCILISTDKACEAVNVYGASKFIAERIFTNFAYNSRNNETKFASVRYGNVIASRGSFISDWYEKVKSGKKIPVTSLECTRFMWKLSSAANFVLDCITEIAGGEIFIPRLNSFTMSDVLNALYIILNSSYNKNDINIIGMRQGEKIHEKMMNEFECKRITKLKNSDIIIPDYFNNRKEKIEEIEIKNSWQSLNPNIRERRQLLSSLIRNGIEESK